MWSLLVMALLVAPLVDAAVRSGGQWQSFQPPVEKRPAPALELLPPRRAPPPYVEAAVFRKVLAPTTTTTATPTTTPAATTTATTTPAAITTTATTTPALEPDAEVLVMPARIPPIWRPSLLGEELVGALLRHTATEEFERSHGQYVDSFIHGQPLGFF